MALLSLECCYICRLLENDAEKLHKRRLQRFIDIAARPTLVAVFKNERMRRWLHVLLLSSVVVLMPSAPVDSTNVVDLVAKLNDFTLGDLLSLKRVFDTTQRKKEVIFSTTFSANNSS